MQAMRLFCILLAAAVAFRKPRESVSYSLTESEFVFALLDVPTDNPTSLQGKVSQIP